ncbi:MAG TPA: hypothetical protein VIB79_28030 [Candidatus Binatia bacterium]
MASDGKYLVVGPPRGGFTLLISVLAILYRDRGVHKPRAQEIADGYIAIAGEYLDAAIRAWFHEQVGHERLFYSKEFSILVGGPKWVPSHEPDSVCVRKYLGVKGEGDFTFILYLPRWVLAFDEIIHSHSHPGEWLEMADYAAFLKFASIRNPIDIIHSSVFSINALASEYIQRELKLDEHQIRRELGLNKLTNPEFIQGLIVFLKKYLDEFLPVAERYDYVMRWEDLIRTPIDEIQHIAAVTGVPVDSGYASRVWAELEHRNLTRYHLHSFRRGVLEDWQLNITNSHLRMFEEAGMASYLDRLGYAPIRYFDESSYTPDQRLIEDYIRRSRLYEENLDRDVVRFAFNKTNFIPGLQFQFKHYPRQGAVEIEKSTLQNEELARGFMSRMGPVSSVVYDYLLELRPAAQAAAGGNHRSLAHLRGRYREIFARELGERSKSMFDALDAAGGSMPPPRLVGSAAGYNIVYFGDSHYSVPQSLGPMDIAKADLFSLPSAVIVTRTYGEALETIAKVTAT